MFSQKVQDALRRSGWFPGRKMSMGRWVHTLKFDYGFTLHDNAAKALEEFGGLTIFPFLFDPLLAAELEEYRIGIWNRRLNAALVPVATNGQSVLLVEGGGEVLYLSETELWWYGATFEDALENELGFGQHGRERIGLITDD